MNTFFIQFKLNKKIDLLISTTFFIQFKLNKKIDFFYY